jgi:hypothetical protein
LIVVPLVTYIENTLIDLNIDSKIYN